ncbi:hypothetical protein CANTEDRAFT_107639, partial [Yamadazyma tenuis ATCC 10573]
LSPIVDHLKSGKKVTFFSGAGVSTAAGIPDFRSPKTGLYSNLARLNLPYAEAVFDIDYFKENPKAFYTLAEELYPGKFQPTSFHYFLKLVQDKGLLKRVYTQNIDTLERVAGIKDEYIVEAHGSFASNHCVDCNKEMSVADVKKFIAKKEVPVCPECKAYVKPDITFFGESLPARFYEMWDEDVDDIEFAIVAGTSLTVFPFAGLPSEITGKVTRVLINREVVGDFKSKNKKDIVLLEDCEFVAETLCQMLGWKNELHDLKNGSYSFGVEDEIEEVTKSMKEVLGEKESGTEHVDEAKELSHTSNDTTDDKKDLDSDKNEDKWLGAKLLDKLGNLKI